MVEVRDVDYGHMKRAWQHRPRQKRGKKEPKIVHAEGEFQAAEKLAQAAKVILENRRLCNCRYLQLW